MYGHTAAQSILLGPGHYNSHPTKRAESTDVNQASNVQYTPTSHIYLPPQLAIPAAKLTLLIGPNYLELI
jgi:hypothetical protein